MFDEKHYIITRSFMYMMGYFDQYGNQCTKIIEINRTVLVNKSPLEVLETSIKCIGYDLRGAMEASKWYLNNEKMCPIMVNPFQRIVLFPTRSPKHKDNMWFNPLHIKRTTSLNGKTKIIFRDGSTLLIPTRLSIFNHKLQTAEQLEDLIVEMANGGFTMLLNPEKRSGGKKRKTSPFSSDDVKK